MFIRLKWSVVLNELCYVYQLINVLNRTLANRRSDECSISCEIVPRHRDELLFILLFTYFNILLDFMYENGIVDSII